jgi:hypothetical protein
MVTKEECLENIAKANAALLIYLKEEAPIEKQYNVEAEMAIWDRVLEHLENGEIITIDDKTRLHWVQETTKNN